MVLNCNQSIFLFCTFVFHWLTILPIFSFLGFLSPNGTSTPMKRGGRPKGSKNYYNLPRVRIDTKSSDVILLCAVLLREDFC